MQRRPLRRSRTSQVQGILIVRGVNGVETIRHERGQGASGSMPASATVERGFTGGVLCRNGPGRFGKRAEEVAIDRGELLGLP